MNTLSRAGKNRTALCGAVAERDDIVKRLGEKFVQMLGTVMADVKVAFGHYLNRQWVNFGGLSPSARNLDPIACQSSQQPFSHLRPRRISCAKKEHAIFHAIAPPLFSSGRGVRKPGGSLAVRLVFIISNLNQSILSYISIPMA